jgi:hypothetical protein
VEEILSFVSAHYVNLQELCTIFSKEYRQTCRAPVSYHNYSCPYLKNVLANMLNNYCDISFFHKCRHLFITKKFRETQPVEHISCILIFLVPCNLTIVLVITNQLTAHAKQTVHILLLPLALQPAVGFGLSNNIPVAQWLRYCATNRKVAGSIPGGVIGIFH